MISPPWGPVVLAVPGLWSVRHWVVGSWCSLYTLWAGLGGGVCLGRVPSFRGCRDHQGRPGAVSPLGLLLPTSCSALRVPPRRRCPRDLAPSCFVFVLRVWSFLRAMYLGVEVSPVRAPHTILLPVVTCACAPYTGLVSGITLALGFGVSWILLARCSSLHELRSLSSVSGSHVEELRHIG